jgi:glutaredoxin
MPHIVMYTLSTCPWCNRAKKFFAEHDIPVEFTDYDLCDQETKEKINADMKAAGVTGFPVVWIDGEVVPGYKPAIWREKLGLPDAD